MPPLDINRVFEEIVAVVLGREKVGTYCEPTTEQCCEAGTDCAEDPGYIEVPARDGKELIIVEEEGHETHSSELRSRYHSKQTTQDLPAIFSLDTPTTDGNNKADQCGQLDDGRKAHEEARSPPHGAEVPVVWIAVYLLLGKRPAGLI